MKIVINLGFWETAHLPLPYANINTYFSLREKGWLRGGVGGQFPRNLKWLENSNRRADLLPKHGLVTQLVTVRMVPGEGGGGRKVLVKENTNLKQRASENLAILMLKHFVS